MTSDLATIPDLSPQEEAFCHHILAGETQSEAYRKAYPRSKGWKGHSLHVKAYHKKRELHIQEYLAEARRQGFQQGVKSLEGYVAEVTRVRELAIGAEQFTAAARLIETEGRALGHLSNGMADAHLSQGLGPDELVIAARVRFGSEAARKVALAYGLLDEAAPTTVEGEAVEVAESRDKSR